MHFHHENHEHEHRGRGRRGGFRPPFPPGPPGFGGFGFGFGPGFGPGHGFGPGGHGGPGGRRGGRGRRGNVRAAILALLTERPMHGYEMIQELDQRTGGAWRPSPGSVYPTLQMLEDEGLIVANAETGSRKAYSLTDAAQTEAAEAAATPPWNEFSEETVNSGHDTREAIGGIIMALKQIGFERDRDQWNRAVEVLNETKRKLYQILADSE